MLEGEEEGCTDRGIVTIRIDERLSPSIKKKRRDYYLRTKAVPVYESTDRVPIPIRTMRIQF